MRNCAVMIIMPHSFIGLKPNLFQELKYPTLKKESFHPSVSLSISHGINVPRERTNPFINIYPFFLLFFLQHFDATFKINFKKIVDSHSPS
ncbi:hypothetical protein SAMN05444162_4173 [Paenibacillaceae bacterium GAS479]|nr:hypothetical protein SAMN05444162_4173 [Paenibacillaceae bacterium GAS479]